MRGRVRLHAGGISPGEVRLRRRGASERGTAPGKDIRDISPLAGVQLRSEVRAPCKNCGTDVAGYKHCEPCRTDRRIVMAARKTLKEVGVPDLDKTAAPGSPHMKTRRKGLAALRRLEERRNKGIRRARVKGKAAPATWATDRSRTAARVSSDTNSTKLSPSNLVPHLCPYCFIQLPSSRKCDCR